MPWEVLADATPKANKQHTCDNCFRKIEPGETYRRVRAITDDGPTVWKTCAHCDAVLLEIWRLDPHYFDDDGIDLAEFLSDSFRDSTLFKQFSTRWRDVAVADVALADLSPAVVSQ